MPSHLIFTMPEEKTETRLDAKTFHKRVKHFLNVWKVTSEKLKFSRSNLKSYRIWTWKNFLSENLEKIKKKDKKKFFSLISYIKSALNWHTYTFTIHIFKIFQASLNSADSPFQGVNAILIIVGDISEENPYQKSTAFQVIFQSMSSFFSQYLPKGSKIKVLINRY